MRTSDAACQSVFCLVYIFQFRVVSVVMSPQIRPPADHTRVINDCIVLYCIVLCCVVLYCIVLYCIVVSGINYEL